MQGGDLKFADGAGLVSAAGVVRSAGGNHYGFEYRVVVESHG